jgi:hypothetical protein
MTALLGAMKRSDGKTAQQFATILAQLKQEFARMDAEASGPQTNIDAEGRSQDPPRFPLFGAPNPSINW